MHTKKVFFTLFVLVCIVGIFLFYSLAPRLFGKVYFVKIEQINVIDLPFGSYISPIPYINAPMQDPNGLHCEDLYSELLLGEEGHFLNGNLSCTPPHNSPYLKGKKTPYGVEFHLGNLYVTPQEKEMILQAQEDGGMMVDIYLFDGRVNLVGIIY